MVESTVYTICNDVLYYVGSKQMETGGIVMPQYLHQKIMQDYHDGQWLDTSQNQGCTRAW